ncbi:MAG TPA: NHLP-related RiPP peptide, partial [Solirubrobacteraceae bacterium]|nr:NHLP-related RiPP peptide [Solirubrobacteraceae bacterium]
MPASQADVAAHLLERLLAEPDFRARFRRDPAAACREAGLDELAEEMALGAGKAMMTLDVRESKSSLAGVLMAAAMEGVGLYELSEHVLPHLADVPAEVGDVLSRVNLPSIRGALASGPATPAAPPDLADAADAGAPSAGGA